MKFKMIKNSKKELDRKKEKEFKVKEYDKLLQKKLKNIKK